MDRGTANAQIGELVEMVIDSRIEFRFGSLSTGHGYFFELTLSSRFTPEEAYLVNRIHQRMAEFDRRRHHRLFLCHNPRGILAYCINIFAADYEKG